MIDRALFSDRKVVNNTSVLENGSPMWVRKEGLFSRWNERLIVMTKMGLRLYKRGSTGPCLLEVCWTDIETVRLEDRRGYLTVVLVSSSSSKEGRLVVRRPEHLREWYNTVSSIVKERRGRVMQTAEQFWSQNTGRRQRQNSAASLDRSVNYSSE